jgi:hypothetical protein
MAFELDYLFQPFQSINNNNIDISEETKERVKAYAKSKVRSNLFAKGFVLKKISISA